MSGPRAAAVARKSSAGKAAVKRPTAKGKAVAKALRTGAAKRSATVSPIITMNGGGIIQSASDSVERVFGWTPTELFGQNVKVLIPEPKRSALDRYLDRYRHADRTSTLTRTRRFDAVRKDGTGIQIELSMSRADLPPNIAPFFIGIIRDVSREIDVGENVGDDRERLQHLVTEQTRALATANLRLHLADRLAALGTLAAGLGHDMNNVLLPVRARLNALEHAGVSPAALGHLAAVRQSIAYLQHLSDALHFVALDPDANDDGAGMTDLSQWWTQVGPLLRKAVPKYVSLHASFPASLPKVKVAPHWLTQAILNLIVNAGEAIPSGRRGAKVRLQARTSDSGRCVRIEVIDNGTGMAPATQRRAFDLFFTTKTRSMGTGLGLPLARKVAIRAGGDIEIRSQAGRGTTVTLVLPSLTEPDGDGGSSTTESRRATVSVSDHRVAALIAQVLSGAGLRTNPLGGKGPGEADLWMTDPTRAALAAAKRWRHQHPERIVVLVGVPARPLRKAWEAIAATVIDPPIDFEAIRKTLGIVTATARSVPSREVRA